jgi:RimJ/RimL family protein N-acetyltransferase
LCDEGSCVEWCIAHRETDRPLGAVSLFHRGDGPIDFAAELGYWVLPSARGHHYVGEALPHLIEHAFRPRAEGGLGVTRVHAGADADNEASLAILRRAGLREWGNDRQAWRRADGSLSDGSYVELLATDPR